MPARRGVDPTARLGRRLGEAAGPRVARLQPPAGADVDARHEPGAGVAPAEQHLGGAAPRPAQEDQPGGILRPDNAGGRGRHGEAGAVVGGGRGYSTRAASLTRPAVLTEPRAVLA